MTDLRVQRPVDETRQLLIETKLRPPTVRGEFVARPGLSRRLDQAGSHQLTLVSAPTGYGKTTLLRPFTRGGSRAG